MCSTAICSLSDKHIKTKHCIKSSWDFFWGPSWKVKWAKRKVSSPGAGGREVVDDGGSCSLLGLLILLHWTESSRGNTWMLSKTNLIPWHFITIIPSSKLWRNVSMPWCDMDLQAPTCRSKKLNFIWAQRLAKVPPNKMHMSCFFLQMNMHTAHANVDVHIYIYIIYIYIYNIYNIYNI